MVPQTSSLERALFAYVCAFFVPRLRQFSCGSVGTQLCCHSDSHKPHQHLSVDIPHELLYRYIMHSIPLRRSIFGSGCRQQILYQLFVPEPADERVKKHVGKCERSFFQRGFFSDHEKFLILFRGWKFTHTCGRLCRCAEDTLCFQEYEGGALCSVVHVWHSTGATHSQWVKSVIIIRIYLYGQIHARRVLKAAQHCCIERRLTNSTLVHCEERV